MDNTTANTERMTRLAAWGCDIKGVMERVADDVEFFMELLSGLMTDPMFDELKVCLSERRVQDAFHAAHTLKGILGNLGLTPMYVEICAIVESLRKGEFTGVDEHYTKLMEQYVQLNEILSLN